MINFKVNLCNLISENKIVMQIVGSNEKNTYNSAFNINFTDVKDMANDIEIALNAIIHRLEISNV